MKKLWLIPLSLCAAWSLNTSAAEPEALYNKSCTFCHAAGVNNAPKTFDEAAWKAREKEKGMAVLVKNVKDGFKAMPPKGLCNECTDADYKAIIEYMSKAKK